MKITIRIACWTDAGGVAEETVCLDEEQLLEVLRGAASSPFHTPPEKQSHWELRSVTFGE